MLTGLPGLTSRALERSARACSASDRFSSFFHASRERRDRKTGTDKARESGQFSQ